MKPNIRNLPLLLCLAALCAFGATALTMELTGCSGTPNRVAYQSVGTSRLTVHEALGAYNVWIGEQHAKGIDTSATDAKVKDVFVKWQAAQLAVADAGKVNAVAISTNTAGATGPSAAFEELIANASQYKADLFGLLTKIGVKLPKL